jgi:methionyl-tRNA formyltransferase
VVHVLCSDRNHPVYKFLTIWCIARGYELYTSPDQLNGGEALFLVSCTHYIKKQLRDLYGHVWVIHESDLPKGRGWSPLAWQILEGRNEIVVSILEAEESIDSGGILRKEVLKLEGHELAEEIQEKLFRVKAKLMDYALKNPDEPLVEQQGPLSHYPKRVPEDSRLNPKLSIADQFDLLRICEPRFPAFFEFRGHKYEVTIKKV